MKNLLTNPYRLIIINSVEYLAFGGENGYFYIFRSNVCCLSYLDKNQGKVYRKDILRAVAIRLKQEEAGGVQKL